MARRTFEFEATDCEGKFHKYRCEFHPFESDALPMAWKLMEMASEPIAKLLPSIFKAGGKLTSSNLKSFMDEFDAANLDLESLVRDVGRMIAGNDMVALTKELLKYAWRDGICLNTADARDDAFSGKVQEVYTVVFQVIKHNNFFPSLGTQKSLPSKLKENTQK